MPQEPLKRIVRNKGSGKFYQNGSWTTESENATHFRSIGEAIEYCLRCGIKDNELIMCFPDKEMNFSIPIGPQSSDKR